MKRDLKINYGQLDSILSRVESFSEALEDIESASQRFQNLLEEQKSDAITKLLEKRKGFKNDIQILQETMHSLEKLLSSYIKEMTDLIAPEIRANMMRVDRNDIWLNMKQIKNNINYANSIASGIELTYYNYTTYIDSNYFTGGMSEAEKQVAQEEYEYACQQKEDREENYNILKNFCSNEASNSYKSLETKYEEIEDIYKKIKKYENKDDKYKEKADNVYDQCTSMSERMSDIFTSIQKFSKDIRSGIFDAVKDMVVGIIVVAYNLAKLDVACRIYIIAEPWGLTPEWVSNYLEDTQKMAIQILKDPGRLLASIGQEMTDTIETKGIPYGISYLAVDVAVELLLTKGGSKIGKVDDVADAAKAVKKADDAVDAAKAAEKMKDAVEGASGADPKKLLNNTGKFNDDLLESNYQKYVQRNTKAGKEIRNRLDWKEASDYWTKESPIARGNNYNKTIQEADLYPYHEVNLSNGKRLDSYDPIAGEIISRKATDLDKISEATYRGYLSEISEKYSKGTKIRSNKYPQLDGVELEGQYILEIPATNANLKNIEHYKDIAKEYDVILRFTEEMK